MGGRLLGRLKAEEDKTPRPSGSLVFHVNEVDWYKV